MYGTWTRSVPSSWTQNGYYTQSTIAEDRTMTRSGTVTPGYMATRKKGRIKALPDNAYSYLNRIKTYPRGWLRAESNSYTGTLNMGVNGCVPPVNDSDYLPSISEINALNAKAVTKLRGKLKESSVNLVQAFAERKQTVDLISSTAITMAKMLRSIKKGDLLGAANALGVTVSKRSRVRHTRIHKEFANKDFDKVMANGVLQLNFGWAPLISDVYGSAEMLANKQFREVWNTVRTVDTMNIESKTAWISSVAVDRFDTFKYKYQIRYVCRFAVSNDITHTMSQVGLTNPALIAWELMPWSFVIDWFIPVGNYIASLDATVGLSFVSGTKTVSYALNVGREISQPKQKYVNGAYTTVKAQAGLRSVSVERTKLTSFPSAQLPSFKNPYSLTHAVDALSLLSQFLPKRG